MDSGLAGFAPKSAAGNLGCIVSADLG